jgi:hypothetical protein
MVKTETTRELITNDIFLSLDKDRPEEVDDLDNKHSTLLSALNCLQDFLMEYDRFLARSAGYDCDLTLFMDSLDEAGFHFTLRFDLVLSDQLFLGEGEIFNELIAWLVEMHLNLLGEMDNFLEDEGLDRLLEKACKRAEVLNLDREPYFSLIPTPWQYSRLERRYNRMLDTLRSLNGFLLLKIKKI